MRRHGHGSASIADAALGRLRAKILGSRPPIVVALRTSPRPGSGARGTSLSDRHVDELVERIAIMVVERLRPPVPEAVVTNGLLSKAELAHALRRSTPTIDRWAKQGVPFNDMGSYRLHDLATCRTWAAARPRPGRPTNVASACSSTPLPSGVELRTRRRGP